MNVPVQPETNIGMIGHVDHGKTTLTKALTGEWTDRHSEEVKRGISIRLGYADAAFYKCSDCEGSKCYTNQPKCPDCGAECELQRAVSFVDAPGHETLMATMLSGAAIMNGALLLVAANEPCPQPQTREHLMALSIIGVDKIIVVQNKVDLVTKEQAMENHQEIREFLKGTVAEDAPVIPISAHHNMNIDTLIMAIEKVIPAPNTSADESVRMYVARSFDVNSPGTAIDDLKGAVIGGSLTRGSLRIGDEIEIRPGRKVETSRGVTWEPMVTAVRSLVAGTLDLETAKPGGLVAIGTGLDPALAKSDSLVGRIAGEPGTLPGITDSIAVKTELLKRVVGVTSDLAVEALKTNEPLMLSVGTATTVGIVTSGRADSADISLKIPVCAEKDQRIAMSRRIAGKWRLIGYGVVQ
ncbi:MAG: translation initiation factor IF-2 subunit gamma [Methanobacteriota archaeon]|nr:MAG: translation initiation factor IF-2 subunit gamma [Euryarchaeota archaeon]